MPRNISSQGEAETKIRQKQRDREKRDTEERVIQLVGGGRSRRD